jgi:hypothetical protein
MTATLALGTVQFGVAYGVSGAAAPVPEAEVGAILRRAHALGVHTLDTAAAYGDIEQRLARLCGDLPFEIVSKLPPLPQAASAAERRHAALSALARSRERLGSRLRGLLFHRTEDLLETDGEELWQACVAAAGEADLALGVSCYSPDALAQAARGRHLALAQLPASALDQRLVHTGAPVGVELHVRSVFLQGLLLMRSDEAVKRVPAAAGALARWRHRAADRGLTPLQLALACAKGLPGISRVVVGVDSLAQLEQIAEAWATVPQLCEPGLACDDLAVIDPRHWSPA